MIGTRLGPYEVTAKLGEGGMGSVWRATDTKLGREVALKLLPDDFADDPERHARFEREARLLASLNHPNIAILHALEHLDGRHALVMELVEGEGLDELIARGQVPVDQALPIAQQIAQALETAHEHGIVHRDLKPANVRIRPDGTVKVLDFGLAKAWAEDAEGGGSLSPTISAHHTREGVIVGTAAYMAPEQATGRAVDKRADIWAFGVVLYEMLTGRQPFLAATRTETLSAVLTRKVEMAALPAATPPAWRRLLRRCLDKDPRQRLRDIGDARIELAETVPTGDTIGAAEVATSGVGRRHGAVSWIATVALAFALGAGVTWILHRPSTEAERSVHAHIVAPENVAFNFQDSVGGPVLSPDGSKLVFAGRDASGDSKLWVRSLDSLSARPVGGTEGASFPFWSPDGRWIGFFAAHKLRKVDLAGGRPQTICEGLNGRGGAWSPAGVIVFEPKVWDPLEQVPAAGGTATSLLEMDTSRGQTSQRWPSFLPDGRHFVYWAGNPESPGEVKTNGIYVASLDESKGAFLFASDSNALYSPPGFLLYLLGRTLMAQPFDAARRETTGIAFPIVEEVANPGESRLGDFSVARDQTLVYATEQTDLMQVVRLDSTGRRGETVGAPEGIDGFRLSPDGTLLVEQVSDAHSRSTDLWIADLAAGGRTRFTFGPGIASCPVWSPDGERIAYAASPKGHADLFVKDATGAKQAEVLLASGVNTYPSDWSPDGRSLAVTAIDPGSGTLADIWIVQLAGEHAPKPFLATPAVEGNAVFSADGRFVAYRSNESGRSEIYLTRFPGPAGKWQVSDGGGAEPLWRHDGGALFYRSPDGALCEATITEEGAGVRVGSPHELVKLPQGPQGTFRPLLWSYTVPAQGGGFLALQPNHRAAAPLTLVTHWTSALRR